jgi:hypothetical protein
VVVVEDQKKPEVIPLTSPEFLFLLQRMDNLEAKLYARIDSLESKLDAKIDRLETTFKDEIAKVRGDVSGVRGLVWTSIGLMLGALALTATVIMSLLQH